MHSPIPALAWTDWDTQAVARKYADSAARAAANIWESAREVDSELTADIVNAASESGMTCDALAQRIISSQELREMIVCYQNDRASVHGDYRVPEATLIDSFGGPFRFTLRITDHDHLPRAVVQLVRTLQADGWTIDEIAHSYHDQSLRKAFTLIGIAQRGGRTKIRVHSDDSVAAEELAAPAWVVYTEPDSASGGPSGSEEAVPGKCSTDSFSRGSRQNHCNRWCAREYKAIYLTVNTREGGGFVRYFQGRCGQGFGLYALHYR